MGAYKYISELYKKKQSDVLRFLLRVRWVNKKALVQLPTNYDLIQMLGVPSVEHYPQGIPPISSRQSAPFGLQSQARLCYLPCACQAGQPQKACAEG
jgi:hypothetical protein